MAGNGGFHVLLVDHDVINLARLQRVLAKHAYGVTPTDSAIAALSMILKNAHQYDIVISEIAMPEIDGFKFLEQIRVRSSNIPVIILMTANVERGMPEKALNLGASCFLKKPIGEHDLVDIWHHVVLKRLEASEPKGPPGSFSAFLNRGILNSSAQTEGTAQVNVLQNDGNGGITNIRGSGRRTRIVWTDQLQRKFKAAVMELGGGNNAKPRQILKLMNDPNLTVRHISNHLQKCRTKAKKAGILFESIPISDSMPQLDVLSKSDSMAQLDDPNLFNIPHLTTPHSMEQLDVPNLSNGNGEGNTDGMYSSALTTPDLLDHEQWQRVFSKIMGNQRTFMVMPKYDFVEIVGPSSASANSTNSMKQMQNLSNDQQQKLWDLPSSSNVQAQDLSFERHQVIDGSSGLANGMGLNTNVRNSPTTTAHTVSHGQGHALEISPYLSGNTEGLNNEQSLIDSQEIEEQDVSIDWESLAQEAGVVEGSDVLLCSKPRELETWCLDDLMAILGDYAKFEEQAKTF